MRVRWRLEREERIEAVFRMIGRGGHVQAQLPQFRRADLDQQRSHCVAFGREVTQSLGDEITAREHLQRVSIHDSIIGEWSRRGPSAVSRKGGRGHGHEGATLFLPRRRKVWSGLRESTT